MKTKDDQSADAVELRRRAEERLQARSAEGNPQSEADTARLVHELQVHQIELEMQNEELQQARARLEALLTQYTDLYDFAPTGYLTLDPEGAIRLVNLTGARLLGIERSRVVKRRFGQFVAEGDRRAFSDFLAQVFASQAKECCEVTLPQAGQQPLVVRLEGTRSADGQECRAVVVDITERHHIAAERERFIAELRKALAEVKTLQGIIPICAGCKKIRDDQGFWSQVETYVAKHSEAKFSHGMCPDCVKKWYPEVADQVEQAVAAAAISPSRQSASAPASPAAAGGQAVLLAVTDPATREVARQALVRAGFTAMAVADGPEAAQALSTRRGEFGLAVIEQAMPLMDGVTTLYVLRRIQQHIQAVFLTDTPAPAVPPDLRPNVRACLVKPFTDEQLVAAVRGSDQ